MNQTGGERSGRGPLAVFVPDTSPLTGMCRCACAAPLKVAWQLSVCTCGRTRLWCECELFMFDYEWLREEMEG